jgi:RNA polymerase sigma-70 factor (ECF subfamily)
MNANPVLERTRLARGEGSPQERTGDLYERFYDRVFGYCLYKLGDRQEAEDAAQTTFLWVMRALEQGIEPRMEANWLFTIAQNACRARLKTRGRKRQQETLSDPQILERVAPGRPGVQVELVGLEEALRDMPELQRQAIILREWRGFSYKEIAAELGLSDAAVETLIFRARRSLASRLENPNARPAKRAALALNLGSIASALKSLVGLGGGVNLAALAATAAAVAIGVGVSGDSPSRTTSPVVAPSTDARPHVNAPNEASKPRQEMPRRNKEKRQHASSSDKGRASDGSSAPSDASPGLLGTSVAETATDTLTPATDLVDSTIAEVTGVVGSANDALASPPVELPPLP